MATALAETVSHYIPTFDRVELHNTINSFPKDLPTSPDGAGGDFALVLTQSIDKALPSPPTDNASSVSSSSNKMQKKLEYESGVKQRPKQIMRSLSKSLRPTKSKPLPDAPQQATLPTQPKKLQHTISQHELRASGNLQNKRTTALKQSGAELKKSSSGLRTSSSGLRTSSSGLKGSGAVPQRKASNAGITRPAPVARSSTPLKSESKPVAEIKKVNDVKKSGELKKSGSLKNVAELRRSGSNVPVRRNSAAPSQLRNTAKADPLNILLNDLQAQKQRAMELSQVETDIYREEVSKYEAMVAKKKADSEAAITLANNIKDRESKLERLFAELHQKEKVYAVSQEELAAFEKEVTAEVFKEAADNLNNDKEKSSALRMQEAARKKAMKESWKNADSTDPAAQQRKRMVIAQEELADVQSRITALKKELGMMKGQAAKGKSSDQRLRDERIQREENRKSGVPKPRPEPKVRAPRVVEKKTHLSRLEEEKLKRAAARKKPQSQPSVADLIMSQAGGSRTRTGSPYRSGLASR